MWTFVLLLFLTAVAYYAARRLARRDVRYAWGAGGVSLVTATVMTLVYGISAYMSGSVFMTAIYIGASVVFAWWMFRNVTQLRRQNFWTTAKAQAVKQRNVILSRRPRR